AEAWIEDGGAKNVTGVTVLSGEAALSNRSGQLKVRAGAQAGCAAGRKPRRIKPGEEIVRLKKERDDLSRRLAAGRRPKKEEPAAEEEKKRSWKKAGEMTHGEKEDFARDAHEILMRFMSSEAGNAGRAELKQVVDVLRDAGDDMAAHFVEIYHRCAPGARREAALMLTLMAGGRHATALLNEYLTDIATPIGDRRALLRILGKAVLPFPVKPVRVGPRLAGTAMNLAQSEDKMDRSGATVILGWYDDPSSRQILMGLAEQDPEEEVRIAAVRALAKVGDEAARQYLEAFAEKEEESEAVKAAAAAAAAALKKKYGE
ncbi:MAG: HEAT repeat domain-containing protein, partial [Planctomycetota bacterium]